MSNFKDLTVTAKLLSPMIIHKESFSLLKNYGLENVYVEDYGHRNKYFNCLFFLFNPNPRVDFFKFEKELSGFKSFYDWYEVGDKKMYVFRVGHVYLRDLAMFKQNRFQDLSPEYHALIPKEQLNHIYFDHSKEIYRFSDNLEK